MADINYDGVPVAFQVLTEIGIINQLSTAVLERALPHKLTSSQFGVLSHFSRLGGVWRPLRLANAFQVTKGAMTNTLQKLEARGFVTMVPDPEDGRAKLVTLTDAGSAAYIDAVAAVTPQIGQLMSKFGDDQFKAALPFLAELRAFLDESRE